MGTPLDHPLAGRTSVTIGELADQPFVTAREGHWLRRLLDRLFAARDLTPKIVCESDEHSAIADLISAGLGIGLAPAFARRSVTRALVTWIPVDSPDCRRAVTLCWGARSHPSTAARLMRTTVTGRDWGAGEPEGGLTVRRGLAAGGPSRRGHWTPADVRPGRVGRLREALLRPGRRTVRRSRGTDTAAGRIGGTELFGAAALLGHVHLGHRTVRARCDPVNAASAGALTGAGFVADDGPPRHTLRDGREIDARRPRHAVPGPVSRRRGAGPAAPRGPLKAARHPPRPVTPACVARTWPPTSRTRGATR